MRSNVTVSASALRDLVLSSWPRLFPERGPTNGRSCNPVPSVHPTRAIGIAGHPSSTFSPVSVNKAEVIQTKSACRLVRFGRNHPLRIEVRRKKDAKGCPDTRRITGMTLQPVADQRIARGVESCEEALPRPYESRTRVAERKWWEKLPRCLALQLCCQGKKDTDYSRSKIHLYLCPSVCNDCK